jgi:hypothetical protein
MAHWSDNYIGRPYQLGEADCAALVADVRREVFRQPVPSEVEVARSLSSLGRAGQVSDGVALYGDQTQGPVDGDVVLMLCAGRPSHVGVYCLIDGIAFVLHAMRNHGAVVRHRISQLPLTGLKVEGYYRWKTM